MLRGSSKCTLFYFMLCQHCGHMLFRDNTRALSFAQLKRSPGINLVQVDTTDRTKVLQSVRYEAVAQELSSWTE